MIDACRHGLDERCLLCVSDTEFEAALSYPAASFPLASADRECPTWLPEGVAA